MTGVGQSPAAGSGHPLPTISPQRGRFRHARMPEFELAGLDYEPTEKSANVVNVERPTGESREAKTNPADRESDRKGSDRVGNARPKGSARRKA
ncbi:hypothetical protein SAM23877_1856 [Streptomyces ambofaciens ATCC 23877]|uniref:Uncharacterized protein n=1 Tax=Streptomyces ambofaciens (strain ATCC 23877 / 3486 / DSM 40053 / JCM 4204 / NBRC 12836 / NRRL B-2516) TaxID=278992 RepID=A0A0K2AP65_STRA7|nr:hypothetical protein SAM23877_1856 [Streptomyces ambofaciens ATCC 23877]